MGQALEAIGLTAIATRDTQDARGFIIGGRIVANVTPPGEFATPQEVESLRRLFIAAPDLLAALRELEAEGCGCDTDEDYTEDGECRHTRARAAIARATGEA